MKKYTYNTKKFNFADKIKKLYDVFNLDELHREWKECI